MTNPLPPDYYKDGGNEYHPRYVARAWGLSGNLFNTLKYLKRAKKMSANLTPYQKRIEDLRKAITYIEFEIEDLEFFEKVSGALVDPKLTTDPNLLDNLRRQPKNGEHSNDK